jgi:hypothetical protein
MTWTTRVIPVSIGLHETGYAHQVVNGDREITVTHHTHRNYDHIHEEKLDRYYSRWTGIGPREPDLTPHPEAVAVAAALNVLAQPQESGRKNEAR